MLTLAEKHIRDPTRHGELMMRPPNFADAAFPAMPGMYTTTRTTRPEGGATVQVQDGRVLVKVDAPGFNPDETSVRVVSNDIERKLEISAQGDPGTVVGYSSKTLTAQLPRSAGKLASPARFKFGVMTVEFEHVPAERISEDASVQHG